VGSWELYDLGKDLGDKTNLVSKEPEKLQELKAAWEKMNAKMADPVWLP
tara:strand:- start:15393 stop:15539 length:147 start_codon:yes stop_codon:yes gene_type:complete